MKTKFVFASFIAALSGLAVFAPLASASPDVHVRVDFGHHHSSVVRVAERDHDRDRGQGNNAPSAYGPAQPRQGTYGPYVYESRREERREERRCEPPPPPRGYWREVLVRVWVPAHWEYGYDNYGRQVRTFQLGRDEIRTERVWVDGCR